MNNKESLEYFRYKLMQTMGNQKNISTIKILDSDSSLIVKDEKEVENLVKRYNQIIDEVYKEFINKCKTDQEFSERWGLKIEERELSIDERKSIYEKEYTDGIKVPNNDWLNSKLTTRNIPTKLITLTYNNETIEVYEY